MTDAIGNANCPSACPLQCAYLRVRYRYRYASLFNSYEFRPVRRNLIKMYLPDYNVEDAAGRDVWQSMSDPEVFMWYNKRLNGGKHSGSGALAGGRFKANTWYVGKARGFDVWSDQDVYMESTEETKTFCPLVCDNCDALSTLWGPRGWRSVTGMKHNRDYQVQCVSEEDDRTCYRLDCTQTDGQVTGADHQRVNCRTGAERTNLAGTGTGTGTGRSLSSANYTYRQLKPTDDAQCSDLPDTHKGLLASQDLADDELVGGEDQPTAEGAVWEDELADWYRNEDSADRFQALLDEPRTNRELTSHSPSASPSTSVKLCCGECAAAPP